MLIFKKFIKNTVISSLVLLLVFSLFTVKAQDDNSTGNFNLDTVNDPSFFIEVFDTAEIIYPNTDVDFHAIVLDIDNTSAQVLITLYYTYSTFSTQNISVIMPYVSTGDPNTYRFEYTFTGKSAGTYLTYYYQAYDGTNIVKEDNSGFYYDIQWNYPPVTIETPLFPDVDYDKPLIEVPNYLLIFLFLSIFVLVIAIFMNMSKSRIESV